MAVFNDGDFKADLVMARQSRTIPFVTATTQTAKVFFLKQIVGQIRLLLAQVFASAVAGTVSVSLWNSSGDDIVSGTGLAIDAVPEKFKTLAVVRLLSGGIVVEKAVTTAITFTAAHVVATASKWGSILVQINKTTGVISTLITGATQTTPMSYASSALALAALPAPASGNLAVGYILVQSKAGATWTANTDDLTIGSDNTTVTFSSGTGYQLVPITTITPLALQNVAGTLAAASYRIRNNRWLVATYTTDGSGALTNGNLTFDTRPDQMRGDPPLTG